MIGKMGLVFHEDDLVWYQNDYALKPKDNVVYEYGLEMAKIAGIIF